MGISLIKVKYLPSVDVGPAKLVGLSPALGAFLAEHLDTSIRMGEDVLKKLGFRAHTVKRLAKQFREYDESALKVLVKFKDNRDEYISKIQQQIESQEALLSGELMRKFSVNDHTWDSDSIKEAENSDVKASE